MKVDFDVYGCLNECLLLFGGGRGGKGYVGLGVFGGGGGKGIERREWSRGRREEGGRRGWVGEGWGGLV